MDSYEDLMGAFRGAVVGSSSLARGWVRFHHRFWLSGTDILLLLVEICPFTVANDFGHASIDSVDNMN
jgi:hypothetical protein